MDHIEPSVSPPPRHVEPWTRVVGHQVNSSPQSGIGPRGSAAFCSCGERQADDRPAQDWREEHLANAWPILIPREADESLAQWRDRLVAALAQAQQDADPETSRLLAAMDVRPGQPYPVISDFDLRAEERVEVLQHQLAGRPFDRMPPA